MTAEARSEISARAAAGGEGGFLEEEICRDQTQPEDRPVMVQERQS